MTENSKTKFLIIGAGPTGLGAACRLQELNETDWLILDRSPFPGGLAGSVVDDEGFTWDQGGHVLFSHYEYFDQVVDRCMKGEWVEHEREAWVWMRNQFIPYPLQNNIWRLPPEDLIACIDGLLAVHNKAFTPGSGETFEDWIYRHFGQGLAAVFFLPYNYKVWAYESKKLSSSWMQERVATVDLSRILKNLILRKDEVGWGPNAKFRFPLKGGTGAIWQRVAASLPADRVNFNRPVKKVYAKEHKVELTDGTRISYDYLINSMPLDQLVLAIDDLDLKDNAGKFMHSSTCLIGVGLEGKPPEVLKTKCWMYFVEDQFPFYRATVFSNYSKYNVPRPAEQWSLLCEVSESPDKVVSHSVLADETIKALKEIGLISDDKIVSVWQKRLEYGYPTPFLGRDAVLAPIDKTLSELEIFSRGRFGAWKYEVSNQDHSFMQGVEAVDHILTGSEEMTYHKPSVVNSGKRVIQTVRETSKRPL